MANNKVYIDIVVDDKGTTKKVALDSDRLRKSLDQAAAANSRYSNTQRTAYRNAQGVAQNTANGTKAFAKQSQGIGGVLVPAYATLAANVFATTAAFNGLNRAAQLSQLEETTTRIGAIAGKNLKALSNDLRDLTDGALSAATAMETVAVATTQNFSSTQIKELTTIAKGASVALGRDMGDAIDRLVRGTAKLEPEILDELGIIVRLDQATREYAASINKNVRELTQFERQQAFANAVTDQGTKKFGEIAKMTDATPYQKLASTFDDLSKTILRVISVALEPFVSILSSSPTALFGVLGVFASGVSKHLLPAMSDLADKSKELRNTTATIAKELSDQVKNEYGNLGKSLKQGLEDVNPGKGVQNLVANLETGTEKAEDFDNALKTLNSSIKKREPILNKLQKKEKEALSGAIDLSEKEITALREKIELKEYELELIKQMEEETKSMQAQFVGSGGRPGGADSKLENRSKIAELRSKAAEIESSALEKMGQQETGLFNFSGNIEQFKIAKAAAGDLLTTLKDLPFSLKDLSSSFRSLGPAAAGAGSALKLFGIAAVNVIPVIGQVIAGLSILWEVVTRIYQATKSQEVLNREKFAEAAEEIRKEMSEVSKTYFEMSQAARRASNETQASLIKLEGMANIFGEIAESINAVVEAQAKIDFTYLKEQTENLANVEIGDWWDQVNVARAIPSEADSNLKKFFFTLNPWLTGAITSLFPSQEVLDREAEEYNRRIDEALKKIEKPTVDRRELETTLRVGRSQLIGAGFSETSKEVESYDKLLKQVRESTEETFDARILKEHQEEMQKLTENTLRFVNAIKELPEAINQFDQQFQTLLNKQSTPFTPLLNSAETLKGTLKSISDGMSDALERGASINVYDAKDIKDNEVAIKYLKDLEKMQLPDFEFKAPQDFETRTEEQQKQIRNLQRLQAAQEAYVNLLSEADNEYRNSATEIDKIKTKIGELNQFSSKSLALTKAQKQLEVEALQVERNRNETIIQLFKKRFKEGERSAEVQEYINSLEEKNNQLKAKQTLIQDDIVREKQAELNQVKQLTDLQDKYNNAVLKELELAEKIIDIQNKREIRNIENSFGGSFIDEGRTDINQKIEKAQRDLLKLTSKEQTSINEGKKAVINAEYALLKAQVNTQAKLLRAEARELKGKEKEEALAAAVALEGTLTGLEKARESSINAVTTETEVQILAVQDLVDELNTSLDNLEVGQKIVDSIETGLQQGMTSGLADIIKGNETSFTDALKNLAKSVLEGVADVLAQEISRGVFTALFGDRIKNSHEAGGQIVAQNITTAMSTGASQIGKEIEKLKNVDICSCVSNNSSREQPLSNEFDFATRDFGVEDGLSPQTTVPVTYSSDSIDGLIDEIATGAADKEKGIFSKIGSTFSDLFGNFSSQTSTFGTTEDGMEEVVTTVKPSTGLARLFENFTGNIGDIFSGDAPFLEGLGNLFSDLGSDFSSIFETFGTNFSGILGSFSQSLSGMFGGGPTGGFFADLFRIGVSAFIGSVSGPTGAASLEATSGFSGTGEWASLTGKIGEGRYGGVFSNGSKMPGYAVGGIAKGPSAGYPAMLHGTEAVVPLPNNRSIPVDLKGTGQQNNVTVNVSVDGNGNSQQSSQSSSQQGANLGQAIAAAVQKELQNQKRSGGILNPYGVA